MSEYKMMEVRVLSKILVPVGEPIFHERATTIRIEDQAAGEYIIVSQSGDESEGEVCFDIEECELLCAEIMKMAASCRKGE